MDLISNALFDRDLGHADGRERQRLKKVLDKLEAGILCGKPLEHLPNRFSVRMGQKRLIYERAGPDRITLLLYRNRDTIYAYLRERGL